MSKRYVWFIPPALLLAGYLYEKVHNRDRYDQFNLPGKRIDIGGRRLYALIQGERRTGQPLVVMEAGHGDWSKCWKNVQPEVACFARVLSYDRAGSGWSDPGPLPRSPEAMVRDLHALLAALGEPGPYLLVGHSLGAPLARLFYAHYPGEVAGMVWVDSAHERMDRFLPFFKLAFKGLLAGYQSGGRAARLGLVRLFMQRQMLRAFPADSRPDEQAVLLAQLIGPRYFEWMYAETSAFGTAHYWAQIATCLGDLPVISLEAQYTNQPPPPMARPYWQEFLAGWRKIHDDVAGMSTRVQRVPVDAGHVIMAEKPEIVIEAIRTMLTLID